jgi:hypothetical protein
VGHPLKYRASPLKYGALTLYLLDLQGSTGSNRELPRLLQGLMRYITQTCEYGLRTYIFYYNNFNREGPRGAYMTSKITTSIDVL